jgi:sulfide:quinone oxidoreductase
MHAIAPGVAVAGQLTPESMAAVAAAGFRAVVNNRPDGEGGPAQPPSAELEAAARAAGLEYRHLPVHPAVQTAADAGAMADLLAELPRPLLMFCRTGTRSARLYQIALADPG